MTNSEEVELLKQWLEFAHDVEPCDAAGTDWLCVLRRKTQNYLEALPSKGMDQPDLTCTICHKKLDTTQDNYGWHYNPDGTMTKCSYQYMPMQMVSKGMVEKEYCVICGKEAGVFQLSEGWRCTDHALIGHGLIGDAPKEGSSVAKDILHDELGEIFTQHEKVVDRYGGCIIPVENTDKLFLEVLDYIFAKLSAKPELVPLDDIALHAVAMDCWQESADKERMVFMVPKFINDVCSTFGAPPSRVPSVEEIADKIYLTDYPNASVNKGRTLKQCLEYGQSVHQLLSKEMK